MFPTCNADGSGILPPLVTSKYISPHCFEIVINLLTKYNANTNSWITSKISEDHLADLDRRMGAKN